MPAVDLATLADAGAFVSREHQAHLADALGIRRWRVDTAASRFVFAGADGVERSVRAHLIGTSSPEHGTWLWGWENPTGFPAPFVRRSERVRALGERYTIPEFTTASLPLEDGLAERLVDAVKAVTGVTAHHATAIGNGDTRAWLLLDDASLALPAPTVARAVGVVTSALAGGGASDHHRALTAWAEQRGVGITAVGEGVEELTLADGSLQVRFDASGHIAGLGRRLRTASRPPVPNPAAATPTAAPTAVQEEAAVAEPAVPAPAAVATDAPAPRRGLLQRLLGR